MKSIVLWAITITALASSLACNLHGEIDRIINEIELIRADIQKQSASWKLQTDKLTTYLAADGSNVAREQIPKIQNIVNQASASLGGESRCTVQTAADIVDVQLEQLVHYLKRDARPVTHAPEICNPYPINIDLSNNQQPILSISGAFFASAPKPDVSVVSWKDESVRLRADLVFKTSDYIIQIQLFAIKPQSLLTGARMIVVSFPQQKLSSEIPVVTAPTCDNGRKDGLETDTDCGGPTCNKCGPGKVCESPVIGGGDLNCASNACVNGRCGVHRIEGKTEEKPFGGTITGSGKAQSVDCKAGWVAVGFNAYTGNYFDKLSLICSALLDNGTPGSHSETTDWIGGAGGNQSWPPQVCEDGMVLRGFNGYASSRPAQIQGECAFANSIAKGEQMPAGAYNMNLIKPSGEGAPAEAQCSTGTAVTGIKVWEDSGITYFWAKCTPIIRAAVQH